MLEANVSQHVSTMLKVTGSSHSDFCFHMPSYNVNNNNNEMIKGIYIVPFIHVAQRGIT